MVATLERSKQEQMTSGEWDIMRNSSPTVETEQVIDIHEITSPPRIHAGELAYSALSKSVQRLRFINEISENYTDDELESVGIRLGTDKNGRRYVQQEVEVTNTETGKTSTRWQFASTTALDAAVKRLDQRKDWAEAFGGNVTTEDVVDTSPIQEPPESEPLGFKPQIELPQFAESLGPEHRYQRQHEEPESRLKITAEQLQEQPILEIPERSQALQEREAEERERKRNEILTRIKSLVDDVIAYQREDAVKYPHNKIIFDPETMYSEYKLKYVHGGRAYTEKYGHNFPAISNIIRENEGLVSLEDYESIIQSKYESGEIIPDDFEGIKTSYDYANNPIHKYETILTSFALSISSPALDFTYRVASEQEREQIQQRISDGETLPTTEALARQMLSKRKDVSPADVDRAIQLMQEEKQVSDEWQNYVKEHPGRDWFYLRDHPQEKEEQEKAYQKYWQARQRIRREQISLLRVPTSNRLNPDGYTYHPVVNVNEISGRKL